MSTVPSTIHLTEFELAETSEDMMPTANSMPHDESEQVVVHTPYYAQVLRSIVSRFFSPFTAVFKKINTSLKTDSNAPLLFTQFEQLISDEVALSGAVIEIQTPIAPHKGRERTTWMETLYLEEMSGVSVSHIFPLV